jgi:hypothetical protein
MKTKLTIKQQETLMKISKIEIYTDSIIFPTTSTTINDNKINLRMLVDDFNKLNSLPEIAISRYDIVSYQAIKLCFCFTFEHPSGCKITGSINRALYKVLKYNSVKLYHDTIEKNRKFLCTETKNNFIIKTLWQLYQYINEKNLEEEE